MGVMNLRAICPSCGGKIHTQPKGLGHFTWARSWFLVQTGKECQHCGVALSGRVKADNRAELASEAEDRNSRKGRAALELAPGDTDVVLTSIGSKKVPVIKVIRLATGLGLKESKDIVDGVPAAVREGIEREAAAELKAALEEAGAGAELRQRSAGG